MVSKLLNFIAEEWPVIVAAFSGFIISFFLYLKARVSYKNEKLAMQLETDKAKHQLELEKIELEKIIANGSYIVCSGCGKKIFLNNTKIYTGGQQDEEQI